MDAADLYHVDRKRSWRFGDEMRVDEHQRRSVPDHVVPSRFAVHHPDVGQPRHDLDVRKHRHVGQPLRETVHGRAAVQQVRYVRRAGFRAEQQHLQGRDHGRRDGVDFGDAQPVRQVRQARRVERLQQDHVVPAVGAAAQQVPDRAEVEERVTDVALEAALRHRRQHVHHRTELLDHVHGVHHRVDGEHLRRVDFRVVLPVAGRQRRDDRHLVPGGQQVQYGLHVLPVAPTAVRFDRQYSRAEHPGTRLRDQQPEQQ